MASKTKALIVLAVVAATLGGLRLSLPWMVRSYVNSEMAEMGDYTGRVEDIDIAVLRGAYTIRNLVIDKHGAEPGTRFAHVEAADLSLQWRALLSGELVGEIVADGLVLNLVQASTEDDTQLGTGVNWAGQIKELFPFQFDRVEATNALITFRAPGIETDDVLTLSDAHLLLENLTNVRREDRDVFADLNFSGNVMSSAAVDLTGQIDPNAALPTFDVDLELRDTELTDVNPWLERFLSIDAEAGRFSMYTELAAANGQFEGYVKPILEQAKIFGPEEAEENPLRKAWEAIVDIAGELFENQATDQIATQIPLSGELENPDAGTLVAIVNLLRNAFVAAFSHSLEGTIDLRNVEPNTDFDPA